MVDRRRFLIGYGERLTAPVLPPPRNLRLTPPYDLATARERLVPQLEVASMQADELPRSACPDDQVVAALTLHPAYMAKSYHPGRFLSEAGLRPIGSRPVSVVPHQVVKSKQVVPGDVERQTTQLFVASTRQALRRWADRIGSGQDLGTGGDELIRIESFLLPAPEDRLRGVDDVPEVAPLEVVLQGLGDAYSGTMLRQFDAYATSLGADAMLERRFETGSLAFIPVRINRDRMTDLVRFTFVRVARQAPRMRDQMSDPLPSRLTRLRALTLPKEGPLDPDLRVAVFDGGLPTPNLLSPWVTVHADPGLGDPVPRQVTHGSDVTSALLFGPIADHGQLERPLGYVDHYRVMDASSEFDEFDLFDVIPRIDDVLSQRHYDFVNLSLGPNLPIDDDEVHAWTAMIDSHLCDGTTLMTAAVGNNGHRDVESGNARIQVPADSVNALSIGAADSTSDGWKRAPYSALGPGRRPGVVKPDVVAFGGSDLEPFCTLNDTTSVAQICGTSFAAPLALRTAMALRAMFGQRLDPLALKALLIHTAEANGDCPAQGHGWGRVPSAIGAIATCENGVARVVYQGKLRPSKYLRAQLPLPLGPLPGNIAIAATLVFATEVDPADPSNYTRSGLEVVFRPNADDFKEGATTPKSKSFFPTSFFQPESELRRTGAKWETVLSQTKRMHAKGLVRPTFDIHYLAREAGHNASSAPDINYAMVISVSSDKVPDLYERVIQTYSGQLEVLEPVLDLPLTLSVG